METSEQNHKTILVDCDVISHFIANNALFDLPEILAPHTCAVLDYVYNEVAFNHVRLAFLEGLIKKGVMTKMTFPHHNEEIKREFARIKKDNYLIGDGERACMAVARFSKGIIASSNFRDVAPYCTANKICYLGTLDILTIAFRKGVYNEAKCDKFIQTAMNHNKARFPKGVTAIRYYEQREELFGANGLFPNV
jgi:hypothetical protein